MNTKLSRASLTLISFLGFAGAAVLSTEAASDPVAVYDLSEEFSTSASAVGSWSYGWKSNFTGPIHLFTAYARTLDPSSPPGAYMDTWSRAPGLASQITHNGTTLTARAGNGQAVFPPGTILLVPGVNGAEDHYGAIRFTAPLTGTYQVKMALQNYLQGSLSGDSDFHILTNGVEVFSQQIPADTTTVFHTAAYTNTFYLKANETVEFLVGRGLDGNFNGSGVKVKTIVELLEEDTVPPNPFPVYNLGKDFSTNTNPSGVWSYGWKSNFAGDFNLYTFYRRAIDPLSPPGAFFDVWARYADDCSQVQHNGTTLTARSGDGGVYPPGTVLMIPGNNGRDDNYAVFRFTAPTGGQYLVSSAVQNAICGPYSGDTEFHVLKNGVEVFGQQIQAAPGTNVNVSGYTNSLSLLAGDTIEFVAGRGLDGLFNGSNLKIEATISQVAFTPLAIYDLSQEFSTNSSAVGPWSYGWKSNFAGSINLFAAYARTLDPSSPPGAYMDTWSRLPNTCAQISHNGTTLTARAGNGQAVFPPGTILLVPGLNGAADNYGAIRFTIPATGNYQVKMALQNYLQGSLSGDSDFHILTNGVEVFSQQIAADTTTVFHTAAYTNTFHLKANETVEFLVGRGLDGNFDGSGVKVKTIVELLEVDPVPPAINLQPVSQSALLGDVITFRVEANGPEPIRYQWQFNGHEIGTATNASVVLTNVQMSEAGEYFVIVANAFGSRTSAVARLQVYSPVTTYTFSDGFSTNSNPAGVWSYGWKSNFTGSFNLFTSYVRTLDPSSPPGAYLDTWSRAPGLASQITHNGTALTAITAGGQGVVLPGSTLLVPGINGAEDNYGAIRFTVPAAGTYLVRMSLKNWLQGSQSGDSDVHILTNDVEVFSVQEPADTTTVFHTASFSDTYTLPAGGRVEMLVGRGLDGEFRGSGVQLQLSITLVAPTQLPQWDLAKDYSSNANPAGVWSYGWKSSFDSAFNLYTFSKREFVTTTPPGGFIDFWSRFSNDQSAMWHNSSTTTVLVAGGQGTYPPGTVLMVPGTNTREDNYAVARFTAPLTGSYLVKSSVKNIYQGSLSGDTDFHVVLNGVEMFGEFIAPDTSTVFHTSGYTNVVEMLAGDTLDFLVGRGADGNFSGSGLTIQASFEMVSSEPLAPVISRQPLSQTAVVGEDVTFRVVATGSLPLAYQWRRNSSDIAGATNPVLTIQNVQTTDAGTYSVAVANIVGTAISSDARLTVENPLASYSINQDFSSNANPSGVWSYGWKSNFTGNFTAFEYHYRVSVNSTPPGGFLDMWSRFANDQSAIWHNSSPTTLLIGGGQGIYPPGTVLMVPGTNSREDNYAAVRFVAPVSGLYRVRAAVQNVFHGSLSGDTDFHVLTNGLEVFGEEIPADTATVFHSSGYTNMLRLSAGETVEFLVGRGLDGNFNGSGLTIQADIHLMTADSELPVITTQPASQSVVPGGNATLSVGVMGIPPLSFAWLHNGALLDGANSCSLVLNGVQAAQAGNYCVRVCNPFGCVTSAVAVVTVLPVNHAPVAVAQAFSPTLLLSNATNVLILAPNNSTAVLILDASGSSDPDGDAMAYYWWENGASNTFGTGVRVTNVVELGDYDIVLGVTDGIASDTNTIHVEIITPTDALADLLLQLTEADVSRNEKRPLLAKIRQAIEELEKHNWRPAVNALEEFQHKVTQHVADSNPALAEQWLEYTQHIIDAIEDLASKPK